MKETYSFKQISEEIQKKKENKEWKPLTSEEYETETTPMDLKDHWLSLRQSIQEKISTEKAITDDREKIKMLSELVTPELVTEYKQILYEINEKTRKTNNHPQREFIDINDEEFSGKIDSWINSLTQEIERKKEISLTDNEINELQADCWLLFNSIGNVMNTKSLEKDIKEFYQDNREAADVKESSRQRAELMQQLQIRYPFDETETEILVDLITSEKGAGTSYSSKLLAETIARLWKENNLGEKKGTIAKISAGYLMSKGAESFAPSLFQGIITQDKFNVAVFLEFYGLNKLSDIIDAKTEIELAKVVNDINHQVNARITNSIFFQEFEFIHEKSLGEIYSTLEAGKNATKQILQDTISKFAPILAGITMSLGFLTKINPALGAIGFGGLPIMYQIAKKQNQQIGPMYKKERREEEKIATRLNAIKNGFEEVKTSAEMPAIAAHVKEQMDIKDTLSMKRYVENTKMKLKRMIPFDVSTISAAAVGGAFQEAGMISGGAILSNIIYSNQLNVSVSELVDLYFNQFSRHIQDIQRMDEILGKYEKLDLPEGEKEKDRLPVTELENYDISIKNLRYKNILYNVNMDIKQGEFVTIAGASGAGKSTLLRNLVGLYKLDGGEIKIGGANNNQIKKYGDESLYSVMSYCNQNPQIFCEMTLRENLLLWSKKEVEDEKIKQVLIDLHLDKFIDRLDEEIRHFSGGEMVRIGLARTLVKGAKIMLLDEPTASLDSQAATEVRKIISEINEKYPDTTIICVSHDEQLINASKRPVNMADLENGEHNKYNDALV